MTDNHCGVFSQYKERLRYCTFRSKTILLELPLRLRNIISHFFTRRYWYQIHKFARYLCGWCVYQIVELSLNRSSFFRGCPASFPCRCCCFPWLGPNFPRQLCADGVNLLFTICAGEQFLDDRFLMVFFLYCSATRSTSNDGPGVRYFRGEVLPAMSDSQTRFPFSFRLLFSVGLNFENVTVLCFDF